MLLSLNFDSGFLFLFLFSQTVLINLQCLLQVIGRQKMFLLTIAYHMQINSGLSKCNLFFFEEFVRA